jgi:hypothetical protein
MLTLFEQNEINKVCSSYLDQVLNAIKNKKVDRTAVRWDSRMRQYVYRSFEAVVNSSGRLYDSAQKVGTENGANVIIDGYVDKLIYGQEPGQPVDVDDILRWMGDKGMESSIDGAKLIATKINRFGSSIYVKHQGQDSGLFSDVNIDDLLADMERNLLGAYAKNVVAMVDETLAA